MFAASVPSVVAAISPAKMRRRACLVAKNGDARGGKKDRTINGTNKHTAAVVNLERPDGDLGLCSAAEEFIR